MICKLSLPEHHLYVVIAQQTESDPCVIILNSVMYQNPSRNKTLWEKRNPLNLSCLLYPLYWHACKSNHQNKGVWTLIISSCKHQMQKCTVEPSYVSVLVDWNIFINIDGYMGSLDVLLFFIKSLYHCHCMVLVLSILYFSWHISLPIVSLTEFCFISIFIKIWSFTCSGKLTCSSKTRQMYMPVYCTWMVSRFDQNQGYTNSPCWVAVATKFCTVGHTILEL